MPQVRALGWMGYTDWSQSSIYVYLICVPGPVASTSSAKEKWYAAPAKVADNFYFIGTRYHSAWALTGSNGIIVLEALFDYAAQDEIFGGLRKLGLEPSRVKYVILSHAHADHDGGTKLLQDEIPGVHIV